MPLARYAVTAEEKLQPEPWLSFILILGFVNFVSLPLLSSKRSVTFKAPKWPPFTITFSAPSLLILLAASMPSLSVLILIPASFSASNLLGVISVLIGTNFEINKSNALSRSNFVPVPAARIGSSTIGTLDFLSDRCTASIIGLLYTIPILIAFGGMSSITDLICCPIIAGVTSNISATFIVFCAVIAVMAVHPYTPSAENVLRSACMPAPAPESLPATDNAIFNHNHKK